MDCELIQVTPRSDEWDALRRCRITASRLGDVMAKETTKRYRKLQQRLVLELTGAIHVEAVKKIPRENFQQALNILKNQAIRDGKIESEREPGEDDDKV